MDNQYDIYMCREPEASVQADERFEMLMREDSSKALIFKVRGRYAELTNDAVAVNSWLSYSIKGVK